MRIDIASVRRRLRALKDRLAGLSPSKSARRHRLVGPPGLWEMKRDFQFRFLVDMGLRPGHRLLDIGCGTLRGGLPLIKYLDVGHYAGTEVRAEVLDEGRAALAEAGLGHKRPQLMLTPDISRLELGVKFDFVWAFSVLIHMSDEILLHTLAAVRRNMHDTGRFFANVNIADEAAEDRWQGFPLVFRPLDFYREACTRQGLHLTDMGALEDFGHHSGVESQDRQRMLCISFGCRDGAA